MDAVSLSLGGAVAGLVATAVDPTSGHLVGVGPQVADHLVDRVRRGFHDWSDKAGTAALEQLMESPQDRSRLMALAEAVDRLVAEAGLGAEFEALLGKATDVGIDLVEISRRAWGARNVQIEYPLASRIAPSEHRDDQPSAPDVSVIEITQLTSVTPPSASESSSSDKESWAMLTALLVAVGSAATAAKGLAGNNEAVLLTGVALIIPVCVWLIVVLQRRKLSKTVRIGGTVALCAPIVGAIAFAGVVISTDLDSQSVAINRTTTSTGGSSSTTSTSTTDPPTTTTSAVGPSTSTAPPVPEPTQPPAPPSTRPRAVEPVYLKDLPRDGDGLIPGVLNINRSGRFPNSLAADDVGCGGDTDSARYHLDQLEQTYSRFVANVGVTSQTNEVVVMTFVAEAGGQIYRRSTTLNGPGYFDVDISGAVDLMIRLEPSDGSDNCIVNGLAVWGDARLMP